ncbi:hypothetical protein FACS189446_3860 [Bacteroidia bacterium]|nr:hypothetical protein FACS189446_3860 [Bacteroidia bacterium]
MGVSLFAQNKLTGYEYWFDNDYSVKVSAQITPATTYQWQTNIPCEQLSTGVHTFHSRFKDEAGQYTTTISQWFQKLPETDQENQIVLCEYWTDNDYPQRVVQNVTPSSQYTLATAIDFNALPEGLHTVNIRFKDSSGKWSTTVSQYFQKLAPVVPKNLVAYEYWFNDNYDKKYSGVTTGEQSFILLDELDASTATKATNYAHFRFKDDAGQWSAVLTSDFYRPVEPEFIHIVGLSEVTFTNTSKYAYKYEWDFGDGNTSTQVNPIHTYVEPGAYQVKLIAQNKEFLDSVFHYVEIEGIKKISNNKGGNNGFASFDIYGGGLDENTVVKLVKDGVTISTHIVYKKEPGIICATFDLTGKKNGFYDIVITINGVDYSITDSFTIEDDSYPNAWTKLEGNNVFIPGRWQTYTLSYGNSGNRDIYGLPINLILSNNSECEFAFDLVDNVDGNSLDINNSDNYVPLKSITSELFGGRNIVDVYSSITNYSDITSLSSEVFDGKMYSVLIPHIPANTSGSFSFRLKVNTSIATKIYVNTGEILNDVYFNEQEENTESDEIFGYQLTKIFDIKKEALSEIIRTEINKSFISPQTTSKLRLVNFITLVNESNCFSTIFDNSGMHGTTRHDIFIGPNIKCELYSNQVADIDKKLEPNGCGAADGMKFPDFGIYGDACDQHDRGYAICRKPKVETDLQFFYNMCKACFSKYPVFPKQLELCLIGANAYFDAVTFFGFDAYYSAQILSCEKEILSQLPCPVSTIMTPQISYDPNEIIGTSGFGEQNFIKKDHLNYTLYFENDAELATAPAQEIFLTDTLDLSKFNPEDFSFGTFTFRDITVEAIPGVTEFSKDVDMRERGENIIVRISATFDRETGIANWHLIALDPETMDLTESPYLGILYPNTAPPIGEGNVTYRIGVKNDLPDGTVIANQAHITFDLNEPIATNVYQNTLDYSKPQSRMNDAYEIVSDTNIVVSWSGSDTGSGIRSYTVYVSENEGDYYSWLVNTPETTGTFEGKAKNKYKFYVTAADNVGNVESKNETSELTVDLGRTAITSPKQENRILDVSPNPVDHIATITMNVDEASNVKLILYNLFGQAVLNVYNQYTLSGKTEIVLDASRLTSGVYILEMKTQDSTMVKRILIK